MRERVLFCKGVVVFLGLVFAGSAFAGVPTEKIRQTTDKIISIVTDPSLKDPGKKAERKALIRKAVDERFDWEEMARRCLAREWRKRTQEEKKEFVELFGKLLERTYLDKVEGYSGEKVIYENEKIEGDYALVKVKVVTRKGTEIPVLYKMKKKAGDWLVYDISIEGVSLVNNYRVQFRSIIARSSYKGLVRKLKAKVEGE